MLTTSSSTKICKNCGGMGWHTSNISKTSIKCRTCRGTGNLPRKSIRASNFEKKIPQLEFTKDTQVKQLSKINPCFITKKIFAVLLTILKIKTS